MVGEGACAYFRTGSFAASARLVTAISELAGLEDKYAPAWWTLSDPEGNLWTLPRRRAAIERSLPSGTFRLARSGCETTSRWLHKRLTRVRVLTLP